MLLLPQPAPLQELHDDLLERHGVRLLVKREDLIHPVISGNKWHKLKYNLRAALNQGYDTLLSFGGPYSNHIHALAGAGAEYDFKTIGVIRGEPHEPLNPTLQFAVDQGMELHYLNREEYRQKDSPAILDRLYDRFGNFFLLPEGGSNRLAVQGCADIVSEIAHEFDVIACACGTGGTLAGLVSGLKGQGQALGIAVLKGAEFLNDAVRGLMVEVGALPYDNWSINTDYHFGGYAKTTPELLDFIRDFEQRHPLMLEQVYTGKLIYALFDLVRKGYFPRGSTLIAIHSGGLQGRTPLLSQ